MNSKFLIKYFKNWWTKQTQIDFIAKQQCFRDQYFNISFPIIKKLVPEFNGSINVNGNQTLGENIAGKNDAQFTKIEY